MKDDYIDQFGGNGKDTGIEDSKLIKVPLVLGVICFVCFAVYLWSAFHSRSAVMALVYFVPLLSIIGLVISFVTRRARDYYYSKIWTMGLVSCALSFVLFFLLYLGTMAVLAQR